jgi:hypothetical protein
MRGAPSQGEVMGMSALPQIEYGVVYKWSVELVDPTVS